MAGRIAAAIVLVLVGAGLLLVAWPQLFHLQLTPPFAQLVSLRGLATAIAIVLLVLFLVVAASIGSARRFCGSLAAVMLAFVLLNAIVLTSRGFGSGPLPEPRPAELTVLSWNTLGGAPGAEAIAALAVEAGADVVSLPETTEQTADAVAALMGEAGHPMAAHTVAFDRVSGARSTSLLISTALGEYRVDQTHGNTAVLPSVVATPADGDGPTLVAVHAVSPLPSELPRWRSDLRWLGALCSGGDMVMAGDFNATIDHLTGLAETGKTLGSCTDAAEISGDAAIGTWPASLPAILGAPIDHVMVSADWSVSGMTVVQSQDGAGSDHRPIVARLSHSG